MRAATDHQPGSVPQGHLAWTFASRAQFEGRAATFLAAGVARNERLLFVADDPRRSQWPEQLVKSGQLVLGSIGEIYGPDRIVVAREQRAVFEETLADALLEGYSGLRVIADNTSLIEGPERLDAWIGWEHEADRFMAEHPVTGLCAFDSTRSDPRDLRRAVGVHDVVLEASGA